MVPRRAGLALHPDLDRVQPAWVPECALHLSAQSGHPYAGLCAFAAHSPSARSSKRPSSSIPSESNLAPTHAVPFVSSIPAPIPSFPGPRFQLRILPNPATIPSSDSVNPAPIPAPIPSESVPESFLFLVPFPLCPNAPSLCVRSLCALCALSCRLRPVPVQRDVGDPAAEAARDGGVEQRRLREPIRVRAAG